MRYGSCRGGATLTGRGQSWRRIETPRARAHTPSLPLSPSHTHIRSQLRCKNTKTALDVQCKDTSMFVTWMHYPGCTFSCLLPSSFECLFVWSSKIVTLPDFLSHLPAGGNQLSDADESVRHKHEPDVFPYMHVFVKRMFWIFTALRKSWWNTDVVWSLKKSAFISFPGVSLTSCNQCWIKDALQLDYVLTIQRADGACRQRLRDKSTKTQTDTSDQHKFAEVVWIRNVTLILTVATNARIKLHLLIWCGGPLLPPCGRKPQLSLWIIKIRLSSLTMKSFRATRC